MITVNVNCSKKYSVFVGAGLLDNLPLPDEVIHGKKAAVITDSNVAPHYLARMVAALRAKGAENVYTFTIPPGENSKSLQYLGQILEFLAHKRITRSDTLVALGGGVVGDITGFAAGVYLRGIEFIQIPTTILAAVDSSVGGKTAVNLSAGKNLAGVFKQPSAVVCDTDLFDTLSDTNYASGVAEAIKYGIIRDKELFADIAAVPKRGITAEIIARCVQIKADIVAEDEYDKGERQLLNFGHTIGHALETLSEYAIPHGYAIASGMLIMTNIAESIKYCTEPFYYKLRNALRDKGLIIDSPFPSDDLYNAALSDKKRSGGNITLVLPKQLGECSLETYPTEEFKKLLDA
ncbi:MAG: 3-dehydroquinate synthase [Oscillospiraceae bacterium]|jgi:3-dehydroquinate synthase|nr:3-dehydroquinate synthase [Oscillospiraceae bacterium]